MEKLNIIVDLSKNYIIKNKDKLISFIKELIPYIIIIIIILLVKQFLFTTVLVNGDSMNDTLHENDMMILDKISYKAKDIKRFDIIVANVSKTKLIKRVIGLPNEHVKYENNELYIDGKKTKDEYGKGITYDFDIESLGFEKIPKNYYLVLGDNRQDSLDSRTIGLIEKKDIIGKATFIIFPFNRFGSVE